MKLIATIATAIALLLGGTIALAAPASADGINACGGLTGIPCEPAPCGGLTGVPCPEPSKNCGLNTGPCPTNAAANCSVEALATSVLVKKVDRLQRIADKRAATIQRLRAKLRAQR